MSSLQGDTYRTDQRGSSILLRKELIQDIGRKIPGDKKYIDFVVADGTSPQPNKYRGSIEKFNYAWNIEITPPHLTTTPEEGLPLRFISEERLSQRFIYTLDPNTGEVKKC
jgi:hypothetical protein